MLHVGAVLLGLLQTEARVVAEVVHEHRSRSLLHPYRTALLILRASPTAVDDGIVVDSHVGERHHLAVAGVGELEGVGAGVVYHVVGYVELAARLHVDSLAAVGSVARIGEDVASNHAVAAREVGLVVVVVVEEAVGDDKLAVDVAEVESRHAAVDGGLEELVLERCRRLGRRGAGVGYVYMVEHHFLRVVAADDAAPGFGLLAVGGEGDGLLGCTEAVEVAQHHHFYRHLHVSLARHRHARLYIERCADGYLYALAQRGVVRPHERAYRILRHGGLYDVCRTLVGVAVVACIIVRIDVVVLARR